MGLLQLVCYEVVVIGGIFAAMGPALLLRQVGDQLPEQVTGLQSSSKTVWTSKQK